MNWFRKISQHQAQTQQHSRTMADTLEHEIKQNRERLQQHRTDTSESKNQKMIGKS